MKSDIYHRSFILLLFLLLSLQSFCQQIAFNKVALPGVNFSGNVCMTQDKNGYMWIGTGNGLYRYDGYNFKIYVNDPFNANSLAQPHIELLYADSHGIIWIATWQKGLDRLDPTTGVFTHFRYNASDSTSLSNDAVRAILEDHEGILWVGTHGGLDRFDPKTKSFRHYKNNKNDPSSLSCDHVRALYEDREGTIWVGTGSPWEDKDTDEGGLNRMDKASGRFIRYMHDPANPHSLINNKVRAIFEDSKGVFWVGTAGDGLHSMDREKGIFERHLYDPAHPENLSRPPQYYSPSQRALDHITFIDEDAKGNIWIGTLENGVSCYDRRINRVIHFGGRGDSTLGFNSHGAWSVCSSRDGVLWIGCVSSGLLYRIDLFQKNISHITLGSQVRAFSEQAPNLMWVGTETGLIRRNQESGDTIVISHSPQNRNSLSSNFIESLWEDGKGVLWVGADSGLNRYNVAAKSFIRYSDNPNATNTAARSMDVNALVMDGSDSLWIATGNRGVDLLDMTTNSFTRFLNDPDTIKTVNGNSVLCLKKDGSQHLWIGSNGGGLNYLDIKTRKSQNFLEDLAVSCLYEDEDSILWVGTHQGLFKSRNSEATSGFIKFVDPGSNIELAEIASIQADNQKNLWISSSLGIYKLSIKTSQTILFASNHGVDGSQITVGAGYKGKGGEIYFGDATGYYVFSPDQLTINPKTPEIIFSDFRIGDKSVTIGANSPLDKTIEQAKEISLTHDQNNFSLDFAGISYSNPQYNRHQYMLQNYDNDWRESSEKTASYYNVPPGEYTFRVRASNSDGVWAERDLKIVISPPWWRTWWAYSFYALCLLAIIFLLDRFQRNRVISKERERNRERELIHAKEIEKAYHELKSTQDQLIQQEKMASLGEMTAGIAHEIQNPLNFVNNFSEVNAELAVEMNEQIEKGNFEEAKKIAGDIEENEQKIIFHGRRADSIVKNMLQHSRTSTGQKELTEINALADEYLRLAYHGLRAKDKSFNATIKTDFDTNIGLISIVPQDIGRVLLNLYNNAFYSVSEKKLKQGEEYEPAVAVSTKKLNGKTEIRVRDNGNGIPQKVLDKIFQPFFTTKPAGEGTGLGLSLSYDIIKAHGGEIKVLTREGEGSEFIVQIPSPNNI